jgi:hypothetical protein
MISWIVFDDAQMISWSVCDVRMTSLNVCDDRKNVYGKIYVFWKRVCV